MINNEVKTIHISGNDMATWVIGVKSFVHGKYVHCNYTETGDVENKEDIDSCDISIYGITPLDKLLFSPFAIGRMVKAMINNPKGTILLARYNDSVQFSPEEVIKVRELLNLVDSLGGVCILNSYGAVQEYINNTDFSIIKIHNKSITNNKISQAYDVLRKIKPEAIVDGKPEIFSILNGLKYIK